MGRVFNIAGPCIEGRHYMLPPGDRIKDVHPLIDREEYFVIHAPRQSGKTTFLRHLGREVNERGERLALYVTLEAADGVHDRGAVAPLVIHQLQDAACNAEIAPSTEVLQRSLERDASLAIRHYLSKWCAELPKPLVLLIDEVDCLADDALINVLRQLRAGYVDRDATPFPSSIALVGMRNIRDYRSKVRTEVETLGTASPFNIFSEYLTIRGLSAAEVDSLCAQHTEDTGQDFEAAATERIHALTNGQPWLVNALARHCVMELAPDARQPVTAEHVERAKDELILKRPTHLDSLMARLTEDRVQQVIEPILRGDEPAVGPDSNEYLFVRDMGLIRESDEGVVVSNEIYREVIPRYLIALSQAPGKLPADSFSLPGEGFDMLALLRAFQQFWRENSEVWIERFAYREAGPHLVLQAFLQHFVNGVGTIAREYAAGAGRVDLCLTRGDDRYAVELKAVRPHRGLEQTEQDGLDQLCDYLERLGLGEGYLVIFDQREGRTWEQRVYEKRVEHRGKQLTVLGA